MKKLFYLTFVLFFISCEDYIGGDLNADPNNPLTVPVANQLPSIQLNLVDTYAGLYSRLTSLLIQQVEGTGRPCSDFYLYQGLSPERFVTLWDNIYEKVLNEIRVAKAASKEQNFNHHLAALNIIEAHTLMIATDVWDDIPYTTALNGLTNEDPTYDDQDLIYETIFSLLDEAITLLNGNPGQITLGSEDVFLSGDIDIWIKAAYAIQARGHLHFEDYDEALAAAKNSFSNSSENLGYQYTGPDAAFNWYRFNRDRTGDIELGPNFRNLLQSKQDSFRLPVLDHPFTSSHPYIVADHFFELISYREMQFLIAEVEFRKNNSGSPEAYEAFLNGIQASFEKLGLSETAFEEYISNASFPQTEALSLEDIMVEKYLALFLQPESYSDYRRTGYPELVPTSGPTIPVRWQYSASEYEFNSSAPVQSEIDIFTDRVGWNR